MFNNRLSTGLAEEFIPPGISNPLMRLKSVITKSNIPFDDNLKFLFKFKKEKRIDEYENDNDSDHDDGEDDD